MTSEEVQDHCDWCFGALTDPARARSRWLGLAAENAWACADCLATGRYRVPPEVWQGDPEDWLAGDQYVLGADDLTGIRNALNEVLGGPGAIEEWEFQTRIGVSHADALELMRRLGGRGIA